MQAAYLKRFAEPGSPYRGKPFFSWNARLEPEELRRQIRVFKKMGMGGFFMHSRVGLDTPYLSEDWFECVQACIDEAKAQDMEAWLYDEDRWPSGTGGGLVTCKPENRMRLLHLEIHDKASALKWSKDLLGAFTGRLDGNRVSDLKSLPRNRKPARLPSGHSLILFRVRVKECIDWYNGQTYLDVLSHSAVRDFIRVTHEAYRKNCGEDFGKRIPGIFTDEPSFTGVMSWESGAEAMPWTGEFARIFKKRYGYDLLPLLPELFLDVEGVEFSRARYHYMDCLTHLFSDAFSRQIGEWCEKNGLLSTGHVLLEQGVGEQVAVGGSAMRFYEHMQAPGMDLLTQYFREYDNAKGVASVARQFGRKWRLTETYGCTGWDFEFEGHKALGDWQAALGINLRCQHLSWYSMHGETKRDYPASIHYQSPWWESYPVVEDYFARINAAMDRGTEQRDLLVLFPNESVWPEIHRGWAGSGGGHLFPTFQGAVKKINETIYKLRDALLEGNIDFDYGDEDILARHAKVRRGKEGPRFQVARAPYRCVLLPPLKTVRSSTLELLRSFRKAGGEVFYIGNPPAYVDAEASEAARAAYRDFNRVPLKDAELVAALEPHCRRLSILDEKDREIGPALHLLKEDRDAAYLFVCNTGHEKKPPRQTHDLTPVRKRGAVFGDVRIRGFEGFQGHPVELDPSDGSVYRAEAQRRGEGWEIRSSLDRLGSRIFVVPRKAARKQHPSRPVQLNLRSRKLSGPWDYTLTDCNALVLDRAEWRAGGKGAWQGPEDILRIDRKLRDRMGLTWRGGMMKQPWVSNREKGKKPSPLATALRYRFQVDKLPQDELFLGIEFPERFRVRLNGQDVPMETDCGWWTDRSLRRIRLNPALIESGENLLELETEYTHDYAGLEAIYLLGRFGVKMRGAQPSLTQLPERLLTGDWTRQGLAFYSGSVLYRKRCTSLHPAKGQRVVVEAPDFEATALRVFANGKEAGVIAWAPFEVDVTDHIGEDGTLDLAVEVLASRRNSHGPLHQRPGHTLHIGPDCFMTEGEDWKDEYVLRPYGLMGDLRLVTRQ